MRLKNITVQLGGFHDHWLRNGTDNPTLLMAAMEFYHYDFICLMDAAFGDEAKKVRNCIEKWMPDKKVYIGDEYMYDWGHILTVHNRCDNYDLTSSDWKEEIRKLHMGADFTALAHIGYPYLSEPSLSKDDINKLIDEDYVDAIQLERISDYDIIKERIQSGRSVPVVGGWDSHYLTSRNDAAKNLYSKDFTPAKHIDSAPGMRTIVFSDDNSLPSIVHAIRQGKSVLEHVETGRLFGNSDLIDMLMKEGYKERISLLDDEYQSLVLENDVLNAHSPCTLKFPGEGKVLVAGDAELSIVEKDTDSVGVLSLDSVPMPVMQGESFLPFYWKGKNNIGRIWAVRIQNNIQVNAFPVIENGKRAIKVVTYHPFAGKIEMISPLAYSGHVDVKEGENLYLGHLDEHTPDIFTIEFELEDNSGDRYCYKMKTGIVVAEPATSDWEECQEIISDSQEQCGGFGSNRIYPGKEVFSARTKFKWDSNYLYVRSDIVDAIHVLTTADACMYRSECICLQIEPEYKRTRKAPISGFTIGFTDRGPVIWNKGVVKDSELYMEKTEQGRVEYYKIPWKAVNDSVFESGRHMGMHISYLNDDGEGLLDNIHWPGPAQKGRMESPEIYGMLYLK